MPDDNPPSENPRNRPVGVPRRFAVGTILIVVTMFGLLFGLLKLFGAPPLLFASVAVFFSAVGVAQMFLFGGRRPREASFVAGALLLPLIPVSVFVAVWQSGELGADPLPEVLFLLSMVAYFCVMGVLLGYAAGCLTAGVFLVLDRIDRALHGPRPEPEVISDGGEPDARHRPPWDERWYDRICKVLRALRPYHRGRPIGDAASLVLIVLVFSGPIASSPMPMCPLWVHLLGILVAGLLLAMLYAGLRLCGWRGLLLIVCLGGACALGPHALSQHVFFFTDQPLRQYVPWWLTVILGGFLGFFVLTVLTALHRMRAGEHCPGARKSIRVTGTALALLAVVYAGASLALLAVSKHPRQRALAAVYRLDPYRSQSLSWDTGPLLCVLLSEEAGNDDLKDLAALEELTSLGLLECGVTDAGLAHLKDLTQLEDIALENTLVTGSGLRHLRGSTGLWWLLLEGSQVSDEGLASLEHFTSIKSLSLRGTVVTDAVLPRLRNNRSIRFLNLSDTQVTGSGFACLAEECRRRETTAEGDPAKAAMAESRQASELVGLLLNDAPVTDAGLVHIGMIKTIERLGLGDTKVTDEGLVHLANLTYLHTLDLEATQVTGRGLQRLKGLVNLRGLNLDATPTDDAGLVHLGQLSNLNSVSLADTKITDAGLAHLEGLTKLEALILDNTAVTEQGVAKLRAALPDCHISWSLPAGSGLEY